LPFRAEVLAAGYANGLSIANTYTNDYALDVLGLYDGGTSIIHRTHARGNDLNLTGVTDAVAPANTQTYGYSSANRLATANGAWGAKTFTYDAVGNRTYHTLTPPGGSATTEALAYPGTSNRVISVTVGATTTRQFVYDGAGNITSDTRSGSAYTYTYNNANRLTTVSLSGNLKATYTYNGGAQLIIRVITNSGALNGTTHYVHDLMGNVIAEADSSGNTLREYLSLRETKIAPTRSSRAQVDMPLAVVEDVSGTPVTYYVHADHLNRPVRMTDATKASVWDAVWLPSGAPQAISGTPRSTPASPVSGTSSKPACITTGTGTF
jgi:YD repeat-containing protein